MYSIEMIFYDYFLKKYRHHFNIILLTLDQILPMILFRSLKDREKQMIENIKHVIHVGI